MYASSGDVASSSLAAETPTPEFIGVTGATTNGGTALTLNAAAIPDTQVGDVLLAVIGHRGGSTGTIAASSPGWTPTSTQINTGANDLAQRAFIKVAQASSDLTAAHGFSFGVTAKGAGLLFILRGVTGAVVTTSGQANASAANIEIPGLTGTLRNVLLLVLAGKAHDAAHSQLTGWVLPTGGSVASGGGGAATRNRVSGQYRSIQSVSESVPAQTILSTTSATSIGQQLALTVGFAATQDTLSALKGTYAVSGVAATLTHDLGSAMVAERRTFGITGRAATLDVVNTWTTVETVAGNIGSYSNTGLAPSTAYRYRVVAINATGQTISNTATATTSASQLFTLIAEPRVFALTGVDASELVPIRETLEPRAFVYTGAPATLANPPLDWVVIDTLGASANSYADIGLDPSTSYVYRVVAVNLGGQSISNRQVVTTLAADLNEDFPASPRTAAIIGAPMLPVVGMPAAIRVFAITGVAAFFDVRRELKPQPAGFDISGRDADLAVSRTLVASAGSYAVTGRPAFFERVFHGQRAKPTADLVTGTWTPSTGVSLYATIDDDTDDAPVDADYISSGEADNNEARFAIEPLNPPQAGAVQVVIRSRKTP